MIKCTAWNLLGKYYDLIGETHFIRIEGGRTLYESARTNKNEQYIILSRIEVGKTARDRLRVIERRVKADRAVELVDIDR